MGPSGWVSGWKKSPTGAVKNAFRHARVTMNARSGARGTGCRSARRWHGPIGAARIATYLHARFSMLNLDNRVHNALGITINNLAQHQQFSPPRTSRAPRAGAFEAQMPHASRTPFPDCESLHTIPHTPSFAPLTAHQLVQLVAQHLASEVHGSSCSAEEGGFRITMECIIAVLKPPLLVTCGNAAALRAERQCE